MTDLVFAAYVEKPTMAETVEPNARMLKNTLDALAASNVPVQRVVLAGVPSPTASVSGRSMLPRRKQIPVSLRRSTTTNKKTFWPTGPLRTGASWTVLRPHLVMGPSLNSPMNLVTSLATYAAMSRELGLPLSFLAPKRDGTVSRRQLTLNCSAAPLCGL